MERLSEHEYNHKRRSARLTTILIALLIASWLGFFTWLSMQPVDHPGCDKSTFPDGSGTLWKCSKEGFNG